MAKIAVDAVLLPSDEMMDKVIEANKEMLKQRMGFPQGGVPDKIVLDKRNCLPHISLAMGCVDEKDIAVIGEILQIIAKQHSLGRLSVIDVRVGTNSVGEKVSVFQIERTKTLRLLHKEVMRKLAPYFSYDVTADMVLSPSEASESTLLWIKNYPEKSSFEKFSPHITIGYGELNDISFGSREAGALPMKFTASRLALCHLGNHCTCRKILASTEIES